MRSALILNPQAGKGRAASLLPVIMRQLKARGLIFEVFQTSGPGHATELCQRVKAEGIQRVIVAGGDGTIREAAVALGESPVGLSIIPVGSGNDYIKSVGIPRDIEGACRVAATGIERKVDLIRVNNTWAVNAVGIGFDALVVVEANRMQWFKGLPLYLGSVLKAVMNFTCPQTAIQLDDRRWEQPILLIACANGHHFGGGFHIAPGAEVDDGQLDVCVIDAVSRWTILQKLVYVIRGTHSRLPEVHFYRARRVRLTSRDVLFVEADGDLLTGIDIHQVEIEVRPGALRLVVPDSRANIVNQLQSKPGGRD